MIDGNKLLSKVDCSRGAPMGRMTIADNLKATVTLFRMQMVDGDYDVGGAYWGSGDDIPPMYAAIGEGFEHYVRAEGLDDAKTQILESYPDLTIQYTEINDDFLNGYITAALWSTNDDSDEDGGEPLDQNYSQDDISSELMEKMREDCRKFLAQCGHLITEENHIDKQELFAHAGHHFWLNRCGHGTGFWDGGWAKPAATILSDACEEFGECWLTVDDGKIYGL